MIVSQPFDPYLKWLGIAPEDQPPNHYRLLGVPLFIDDADVIENAADRQMTHLRSFQSGKNAALSQKLLNEISAAKVCLLDAAKREAYDKQLQAKLDAARPGRATPSTRLKVAKPAVAKPAARVSSERFDVDVGLTDRRAIARSRKPGWRSPTVLGAAACVVLLLIGGITWLALPRGTNEVSLRPVAPPNNPEPDDSPKVESDDNTSQPSEDAAASNDVQVVPATIARADIPATSDDVNSTSQPDKPQTAVTAPDDNPAAPDDTAKPNHVDETTTAEAKPVYLDDLQETEYQLHPGMVLPKHGESRQKWPGQQPAHSLITHPPSSSFAYVDYTLTEAFGKFAATVTVLTIDQMRGEVTFEVIGDDLSLWRSQPYNNTTTEPLQHCEVDIRGVKKLRLKVDCPGNAFGAWAAWIEPRLLPVEDPRKVAASKRAIPDTAAQKRLNEEIRGLFEKEIAAARTPEEILELAKFFLEQARQTTGDTDAAYVMLDLARRAAAGVGDVEVALAAVTAIADRYSVEPWELRTTTLTTVGKSTRGAGFKERAFKLAQSAQALGDEAIRDGQYRAAEELLDIALEAAKKADDIALRKAIVGRADEVELLARQYREFEAALEKLDSDEGDPEANLIAGRFLCLVQGDWPRGLPLLAKCGNDALKRVAELELAAPTNSEQQIKLGDAWWTLAESAEEAGQLPMQQRAAVWYRRALPAAQGLVHAKLEQRLNSIGSQSSEDPDTPELPNSGDSDFAYWKVTYNSGAVRYYEIDKNGSISFTERGARSRLERLSDGSFRVNFGDGKLERLRLDGQVLRVEHFDPAANFPDRVTLTGVGQRLRAWNAARLVKSGKLANVLELADPRRDAFRGTWARDDTTIRSSIEDRALLMIPIEIGGSYEVSVTFTRDQGGDIVAIVLPVVETQCTCFLGADGHAAGLGLIDRKSIGENGTQRSIGLTNGKQYVLQCRVTIRQNAANITAALDGTSFIDWHGSVNSLSNGNDQALPICRHLGLYTHVSSTTFHSVAVRLLD